MLETVAEPPKIGSPNRQILLIGINYWPEQTGNAPYSTGLAEYLAARGTNVTVLTGVPHYPQWQRQDPYRRGLRYHETVSGVDVRRISHYVPSRQSALKRALYEASFLLHGAACWSLPKPDAVIGVVPNLSGGVLARMVASRFQVPYGLIFQDLMGQAAEQSGISGGGKVAATVRRLERWAVAKAGLVAAVAESFVPYLIGIGVPAERLVHIPNWTHIAPPKSDRQITRRRLGWDADTQIVLHAGNMGLKQGLEQIVRAAQRAAEEPNSPRFVLMGDGNQRSMLTDMAQGLPNVTFLPPESEETFPDVLAAADVLLVSERASVIDMSLPSKLTSYFVAGRPVVAAVHPQGGTAREIAKSSAGVVVPAGSPEALLVALEDLRDDTGRANRLGKAGREYASSALHRDHSLSRGEEFVTRLADLTPNPVKLRGV